MHSTSLLDAIIVPPNTPPNASIIWLHGLGADGHDFVNIIPQLALSAHISPRFIFPHAPIRSVTLNGGMRMRAWFDAYGLTTDSKQDEPGVIQASHTIGTIIDQEIQQGIPTHKIILAGFSQGGALALYSGSCYPKQLAGILALSTYLPIANIWQSNIHPANRKTPIFMAHGTSDPILSLAIGEFSKIHLEQQGYSVDWHSYQMGHSVCPAEIQDISHWINKILT